MLKVQSKRLFNCLFYLFCVISNTFLYWLKCIGSNIDPNSKMASDGLDGESDHDVNAECDVCPLCAKEVSEGVDALCCDGPCLTWHHRKCLKISAQKYKQLQMSHQKWFCNVCPSDYVAEDSKLKWGPYTGEHEINNAIRSIYQEIVCWDKNLCFVPLGKVGKDFIKELTRLIELFTNDTQWKSICADI